MSRAPSPRYKQAEPDTPVKIQADDIGIFWHLFCNRVMDAMSIYDLFPNRSGQVISRRLNKLRKGAHPYISRLKQANSKTQLQAGSDPIAYALEKKGAEELAKHTDIPIPLTRWKTRNASLKLNTIKHELAASRFMARFFRDCITHDPPIQMLYKPEFIKSEISTSGLPNTLRTPIRGWYGYQGVEGTAPDRIFSFIVNGRQHYIFLEIDEGTETIVPRKEKLRTDRFWRDTSLLRKFVVYGNAFRNRSHVKAFGIETFRVVTITTTVERSRNIQSACAPYLERFPKGLFLYSDWETLNKHKVTFFEMKFNNTRAETTRLF